MDLGSTIRVLFRRWLVVLLGLALTLGTAAFMYRSAAPRFQVGAQALLLLPADMRGPENLSNPYLNQPNGLNTMAGLVVGAINSPLFLEEVDELGLRTSFEVGTDGATPIISVNAVGEDPTAVITTRDYVVKAIQAELLRIQQEEGAPPSQTAHARVYANGAPPVRLGGDRARAALGIVAAGGILTLLVAFSLEALSRRRATRGTRGVADGSDSDDSAEESPRNAPDNTAKPTIWTADEPPADAEGPTEHQEAAAPSDVDQLDSNSS